MRQIVLALVAAVVVVPVASFACASFGPDASAVDKVQSSWGPAERAMARYRYAEALRHLESTYGFVSAIGRPLIRTCVAEEAEIRIRSARAGSDYLSHHPLDDAGARRAADATWRAFPMKTNCP